MNFYNIMKPKYQKEFLDMQHWLVLFNLILSRYEWEGLPENIPQEFLEGCLVSNGTVGFFKKGAEYWVVWGSYNGDVKGYLASEYAGALPGVGSFHGKVGKDVAVGWNNATRTPDLLLMQYSSILTEIDVSEKINVLFSRFLRIPKAKDQKEKEAIKSAINAVLNGKIDAIVSDTVHDARALLDISSKDSEFLELTDVREVDKLQYLNQYRDNVMKRFWSLYGQRMQVTSKMAQMSNDEVHSNDNVNMVLTLQGLKLREKFCEEVNSLFGLNISVKLSDAWADNYNETVGDTLEGGADDGMEERDGEAGDDSSNNE